MTIVESAWDNAAVDQGPVHTNVSDLDLSWGHKISARQNLRFLAHFLTEWIEIWSDDETIRGKHLDTTFQRDSGNRGM